MDYRMALEGRVKALPISEKQVHWMLVLSAWAILMFVLLFMTGDPKEDVLNFYKHSEAIKSGLMPYRDFVFEFPPFSLVFFMMPGMFTSDLNTYATIFGAQVILFIAIMLHYTLKICDRINVNKIAVAAIFTMFFIVYFPIRKFDVFPACLTVVAMYYFMERRFGLAYGFAAFATLTKIYPGLLILLFLVINIAENDRNWKKNVATGAVACLFVSLLAVLPLMSAGVSFSEILGFVGFHSDRGFQVESLFAESVRLLALVGIGTYQIVPLHDTHDVVGPICDAVLPYWTAVMGVAIALSFILALRYVTRNVCGHEKGWNDRSLILMSLVVILTFMMFNKVFSTQYMVWIMPMMAMIPFMAQNDWMKAYVCVIVLLAVDFGRWFLQYDNTSDLFITFNFCRDVLLVLMMWICVRTLRRPDSDDERILDVKI